MPRGHAEVSLDDERVRMTTWTFSAAGEDTGEHRHEFDYIVVPVTGGTFAIDELDGSTRQLEQVAGSPYLGKEGTEHNVISATDGEVVFVEIELKG